MGVLAALLKAEGCFVSGSALCAPEGLSRAALWKRIDTLRQQGFTVEAQKGAGYRLTGCPALSAQEVAALTIGPLGQNVRLYETTTSTNERAMQLASEGAEHGTVVMALEQTKGKGRLGRIWHSPAGQNLYISTVIRPSIAPREASLLTLLCAVASARTLRQSTGAEVSIKWPNDLMIDGHKLGGILLEMRADQDSVHYLVAGIGINVNLSKRDLPAELRATATSLKMATGKPWRIAPLCAALLDEIAQMLGEFQSSGRASVLEAWRGLNCTLGKPVRVLGPGGGQVRGMAMDIDDEGRLIVATEAGGVEHIGSGDIEQ